MRFASPLSKSITFHPYPTRHHLGLRLLPLLLLSLVLGMMFLLSLVWGSVNIPLDQVLNILVGNGSDRIAWTQIVLKIRLPEALTAVVAGAALGVSGLMMQTFFRNPLADPFILGISAGASLGVALMVLMFGTVGSVLLAGIGLWGDLGLATAAALGAAVSLLLVLAVSRRIQNAMSLLILGLMFSYVTGAMVSLLLYFSIPERIQAYIAWGFGSFSGVTSSQLGLVLPMIGLPLLASLTLAKPLNALLLGETYAESMGVNLGRVRLTIILVTGMLAGVTTAFCGPIGFIGVAVPHLARGLMHTTRHQTLLPATMLIGGLMALLASLMAELPFSHLTLPLNAITALMGAPIVIVVILRQGGLKPL